MAPSNHGAHTLDECNHGAQTLLRCQSQQEGAQESQSDHGMHTLRECHRTAPTGHEATTLRTPLERESQ